MNRSSISRILLLALLASSRAAAADSAPFRHAEATVAQLQAEMAAGRLTSEQLTRDYIQRILDLDQGGPGVNAVIELNPDAISTVSLGTETDGSVVCPANANGVVGLKPTVGLTSRAGVVPISHTQDTVGVHARTVADAAATLSVIQSRTSDGRDAATGGVPLGWQGTGKARPSGIPTDYTQFVDPNGLRGARIGLTRVGLNGFDPLLPTPQPVTDAIEAAFAKLTDAGAIVIDLDAAGFTFAAADGEFLVLLFEFRNDLAAYFPTRVGVPVPGGTLQTAIDFNDATAAREMPFFNQDIFDLAAALEPGPDDPQPIFGGLTYNQALAIDHNAGVNGIDAAITQFRLDAVVSATDNPAWATDLVYGDHFLFGTSGLAAGPGYPIVQVPAGMVFGVPLGISFFGSAFSEPTLIKLASGYEAFTQVRANNLPTFAATAPSTNIGGTTLTRVRKATPSSAPARASVLRKPRNL